MIDKLPTKLITRQKCNDWNSYSQNLTNYKYVSHYLGEKIKFWVENLKYPLEVTIIYNLFLDKLNYLDDNLNKLETWLGKENLIKVCNEIEKNTALSYQVNKRFTSLNGEIEVFNELKTESNEIVKINEYGDWIITNRIISVKTITDLDYNYKNIENTLKSLSLIIDNEIIRKYNDIKILNAESINYNSLENTLEFIRSDALTFLEDYSIKEIGFPEIGEQQEFSNGKVKIYIDSFEENGSRRINFTISPLMQVLNGHSESVNIEFRENEKIFENIFAVTYDIYGYFREEKFNLEKISKRIQQMIDRTNICEKFENNLELWIVLSLHDKHANYIINESNKLQEELKEKIKYKSFEVYLLIVPQFRFELKNNVKIKLN